MRLLCAHTQTEELFLRKSGSWALKPLQAPLPLPRGHAEPPELNLSRLEVEIVPGVPPGAGAGGLSDGECSEGWAVVAARLGLSRREAQIIRGLVKEQKDQAIAHELGMTYNTLRKQLSRLSRKPPGVRGRGPGAASRPASALPWLCSAKR